MREARPMMHNLSIFRVPHFGTGAHALTPAGFNMASALLGMQ